MNFTELFFFFKFKFPWLLSSMDMKTYFLSQLLTMNNGVHVLVISHERFLSVLFCLSSSQVWSVGGKRWRHVFLHTSQDLAIFDSKLMIFVLVVCSCWCPVEFSCNQIKFLFTFSVTLQNALCASLMVCWVIYSHRKHLHLDCLNLSVLDSSPLLHCLCWCNSVFLASLSPSVDKWNSVKHLAGMCPAPPACVLVHMHENKQSGDPIQKTLLNSAVRVPLKSD